MQMFLEFYKLRQQPFGVTPDPRFLYLSHTHREALASLVYGVEQERGFLALIAKPGMGKTTMLYQLLERLRASARTAFLFNTQCDSRQLLSFLLADLGVDLQQSADPVKLHEQLHGLLLRSAHEGQRCVFIIDEAQNLDTSVLETVRLLSNFETPRTKLLQIVISGQPSLADRLAEPGLAQFRQRISIMTRLKPLAAHEAARYVHHRLRVAGYEGENLFTRAALERVAILSEGIPRVINNLCFNALSLGYALDRQQIDAALIEEVALDLHPYVLLPQDLAEEDAAAALEALEEEITSIPPYLGGPGGTRERPGRPVARSRKLRATESRGSAPAVPIATRPRAASSSSLVAVAEPPLAPAGTDPAVQSTKPSRHEPSARLATPAREVSVQASNRLRTETPAAVEASVAERAEPRPGQNTTQLRQRIVLLSRRAQEKLQHGGSAAREFSLLLAGRTGKQLHLALTGVSRAVSQPRLNDLAVFLRRTLSLIRSGLRERLVEQAHRASPSVQTGELESGITDSTPTRAHPVTFSWGQPYGQHNPRCNSQGTGGHNPAETPCPLRPEEPAGEAKLPRWVPVKERLRIAIYLSLAVAAILVILRQGGDRGSAPELVQRVLPAAASTPQAFNRQPKGRQRSQSVERAYTQSETSFQQEFNSKAAGSGNDVFAEAGSTRDDVPAVPSFVLPDFYPEQEQQQQILRWIVSTPPAMPRLAQPSAVLAPVGSSPDRSSQSEARK